MNITKVTAMVLRTLFESTPGNKNFNYHYVGTLTSDGDRRYRMIALQEPFHFMDATAKWGWMLGENTQQILEGIEEALPLLQIDLNASNKIKLGIEIDGQFYDYRTQKSFILSHLLNQENLTQTGTTKLNIIFEVDEETYINKLKPFFYSDAKTDSQIPTVIYEEETVSSAITRIVSSHLIQQGSTLQSARDREMWALKVCTEELLGKSWGVHSQSNGNAQQVLDGVFNTVRSSQARSYEIHFKLPAGSSELDLLVLCNVLKNLLGKFHLDGLLKNSSGARIHTAGMSVSLFDLNLGDCLKLISSKSVNDPVVITLSLTESKYTTISQGLGAFSIPAITPDVSINDYINKIVAANQSLVIPQQSMDNPVGLQAVTYFDSDNEDDGVSEARRDRRFKDAMVFDGRETKGTIGRHHGWFTSKLKPDSSAVVVEEKININPETKRKIDDVLKLLCGENYTIISKGVIKKSSGVLSATSEALAYSKQCFIQLDATKQKRIQQREPAIYTTLSQPDATPVASASH